jgi:acetyl esterase/lipase
MPGKHGMASLESKLFNLLLVLIRKKRFLEMQFAIGKFDFNSTREPPVEIYQFCHVDKRQVCGRNTFTLRPKNKASGVIILYFHGGAYVQNFVKQHWRFLAMLVNKTGCTVVAPDYPLAPSSTFVAAYEMITVLYKELIAGSSAADVILMGDSAGGGLALGFAQRLRLLTLAQPGKIVLLSPWLDITLSNPGISSLDESDPFLSAKALRRAGLTFAGGADPSDPMLSPVNGSLKGLGELFVFVGSRDILVADTRKLKAIAIEEGVKLSYREYDEMIHVWMFLNFPESMQVKKEIVDIIRAGPGESVA